MKNKDLKIAYLITFRGQVTFKFSEIGHNGTSNMSISLCIRKLHAVIDINNLMLMGKVVLRQFFFRCFKLFS